MNDISVLDAKRQILAHFIAALAYRTQKALKNAPDSFADFRVKPGVRTPRELVNHMTSVLGYARTFYLGGRWNPEKLPSFENEIARLHEIFTSLRDLILSEKIPEKVTLEQLLQGPLSDAMTHAGQLALLRRLYGHPVPPENFVYARISSDNVGPDQPDPAKPDKIWKEPED